MKEQRKLIIIENEHYILREAVVDLDGETVWDIQDQHTNNTFVVHTREKGEMYITFFKGYNITSKCKYNAIHKICEILLERGVNPTINIYYKNNALIKLCCAIGFRKVIGVKHLYYLRNLK